MFGVRRRAFTLVEILAVISIIGVLAAIVMPVISSTIDRARKLKASKNLQQIAAAYASFSLKGKNNELYNCKNAAEWAELIAEHEGLNVASLFIMSDDYLVESTNRSIPKTIGIMKDWKWHPNPEFKNFPMSVVVISGISSRAPAPTTPIAYTRGLDNESGKWRGATGNNGGVYGESGGFIVFLDGHVEFFNNLTDDCNMLVNFTTGEKTSKISEAVPPGARALSWTGIEWETKKDLDHAKGFNHRKNH
jgi:prepilin-type N-terminal cleavage/methylation domain-containing protein